METDTRMVNEEKYFQTEDYGTIFTKKEDSNDQTRVIDLLHESLKQTAKIREDIMDKTFPSIWVELERENEKNLLICGFYREWSRRGDCTQKRQMEAQKTFITLQRTAQ